MSALMREPVANIGDQEMQQFLCGRYWLPEADFPLCHDVFSALRITGSDCHDFMENFAVVFNVDLSDFVWPKYHLSESEAQDVRTLLRPFMRMAGLTTRPLNRDLLPISIDHLLMVAAAGRWVEPATEAEDQVMRAGLSRNISRFGARLKAGGVPRTRSR